MDEPTSAPSSAFRAFGLIALGLILGSCNPAHVRPDTVIPATQANYHTAEFQACGSLHQGVGICPITTGQDLNNVGLSIQGYYQGTIRISTTCRLDNPLPDSMRYMGNAAVAYYLTGKAQQSCLVSFVVSPEYPDESSSAVRIHSFVGHLWIKVLDPGLSWMGFLTKAPIGPDPTQEVKVLTPGLTEPVQVLFESDLCHVQPNPVTLPVQDGALIIPLKAFVPVVDIVTCVMSGVAFLPSGPMRLTWFLDGYDSKFIPMPIPQPQVSGSSVTISSDNNTSVIAFDGQYVLDQKAKFDWDSTKTHVLRLLTSGGRSIIGQYDVKKGWSWMY